jgi:MFS family permease
MNQAPEFKIKHLLNATLIVAALGYFVDIYDLILFSIVRIPSLKSIGINSKELIESNGLLLINIQMFGMLIGGIFWGILGDKKGRLSVLFGSILLYSLANIANGMVTSLEQYKILRFIAGFGLAGELGAGITLVVEQMHKEHRGYGTTMVATIGVSGAIFGGLMGYFFGMHGEGWRTCYYIGGGMGLMLLIMRIGLMESGMFEQVKNQTHIKKGNLMLIFSDFNNLKKYIKCILIGWPCWYVIGILVTLSPEFSEALKINGKIVAPLAVAASYAGTTFGDLLCGIISQKLRSRTKTILIYLLATVVALIIYFMSSGISATMFYFVIFLVGTGVGYWAVFVTIAAESFGTNIRSTVTTTVPNFVRGSLPIISAIFTAFKLYFKNNNYSKDNTLIYAAIITGIIVMAVSIYAASRMEETFHKDLNYVEQ